MTGNVIILNDVAHPSRRQAMGTDSTIQRQLGADWCTLDPAVRQRFARDPAGTDTILYQGAMETVRCSAAGRLFALATRLIGNPLTPYEGQNVPMDVLLFHNPTRRSGVCWQRTYHYAGRKPYTVTSTKREDAHGQMLECVGGGFGMILRVTAETGDLHFRSTRYFLELFGRKLPLPHLLTPGKTHVVHQQVAGETFRFTIRMVHPWLGETFYQTGLFSKVS